MKRTILAAFLLLTFVVSALAAGYTTKTITIPVGTSEVRFTPNDGTFTNRFYISPSFSTDNGAMAIGASGVSLSHGYTITHTMAIHGTGLLFDTGMFWEKFDLHNFFAICNETLCELAITYPVQE